MKLPLLAALPVALLACSGNGPGPDETGNAPPVAVTPGGTPTPTPSPSATPPATVVDGQPFGRTVVADFDAPWAMTFLPDRRMLVTEKDGRMLLVAADGQQRQTIARIGVDSAGQGGLMDVVLAPDFAQSGRVYFSYSAATDGGKHVVLARGTLRETNGTAQLAGIETLWSASPAVTGDGHYSGRIAFSPDGQYLFLTAGDRQKFTPAQAPKATLGKVLRLTPDGKPAPGNPLAAQGFDPAVWSYGHRNLLGLAFDASGNLWEQEMGPKGGDEVNLILPGRNYGWPNASNGSHYDGRDIPDHRAGDGYEAPKISWNPVISPGGLMIYSGSLFPQWRGDAFIGGLSSKALVRVDLNGTSAAKGDQWDMGARIREVEQGPDGAIYVLEDGGESQGRLIRLTPAA
ncbi:MULTISPECIES: PQQ-dependent sugar dehydrogenase [unclassified Sphingomonas]|uniref:PQQ-dependent sugar dehydrogenase n=1 Tax=unclassified Sphingomonas TaxID=196159 RepID=UPI002862C25B|nr:MULTISPECIES: PQQ-dependent sugar dehydrogenase [unclassified Sphingomonas]MDR6114105.1 glucose/arabinose dehydrogenase [Sphingomonas sp. SORGH_AS_0789]MDR6148535.1 glucose/arabinose dehydrogenase [Sphingomonas sp. SORGH_AS_0742]